MQTFLVLLSIVGTFALVFGQPKPCETPRRWQGSLFEIDPSKSYDRLARIFYDAIEERIAIHEHEDNGQQRDSYDEIALYQKDVIYRINRRTRECTTSKPTTPFRHVEVPPNATYYGTYFVGSTTEPLAGFRVNSFGGDTEKGRYVGTWTYVDCMPVTDTYIGGQTGFVHWSFYDLILGIEDPDVFIPPEECL